MNLEQLVQIDSAWDGYWFCLVAHRRVCSIYQDIWSPVSCMHLPTRLHPLSLDLVLVSYLFLFSIEPPVPTEWLPWPVRVCLFYTSQL
jgi:hypothetical protein